MKFRFEIFYRAGLLALFFTVVWSVWASAQEPVVTNKPPTTSAVTDTNKFQALTFGLDNIDVLNQHTFLEQPLWKYLASLIYLVLAFCVAWLLDWIVNVWLKRLAAKTETKYDDLLLGLLRGPVKVGAFVIFLNIGLGVFDWPARAQLLFSRGLIVIVACSVTYVALKVVELLLGVWREKIVSAQDKAFAEQLFPLLRKVAKVAIIIAAAVLTADNLDIKITSLLAGLSVGGLALGLAAQDTVANLFGAVAIFLDKPFHIGDLIKVEGVDGTVESIGLRSTRRPAIRTEMNLGLTYDTPVEKVKRATVILEEIFRANPKTADLIISFNKFGDSALNIFVVHIWNGTDAKAHFAEMQELNLKIKERFDAEKIELAFPTRTIHLKPEK